jgi:formate hydrogenlyase subunit 4
MTAAWIAEFVQAAAAVALAPALVGFIRWLKARFQSRRGAPLWQPYRELAKLFQKEVVVSRHASWVFHVAPYAIFGSMVATCCLIPTILIPTRFSGWGDLIALVYLLLLGTFWLALAGLDPASAFGGMGSSREMTVAALTEPTLAIAIFAVAIPTGSTGLGPIVERTIAMPSSALGPGHVLAFAALFIVALAEAGRLPVDNPSTHLELTMIHEAMVLEYSGRYLALIEWASAIKLFVFCTLLVNLFLPWGLAARVSGGALVVGAATFVAKLGLLAFCLALFETRIAKLRLFRVPELLSVSFVLALLAVVSAFLGK